MLFGLGHLSRKILWIFFCFVSICLFLVVIRHTHNNDRYQLIPQDVKLNLRYQFIVVCFKDFKTEKKIQLYHFCFHFTNDVVQSH